MDLTVTLQNGVIQNFGRIKVEKVVKLSLNEELNRTGFGSENRWTGLGLSGWTKWRTQTMSELGAPGKKRCAVRWHKWHRRWQRGCNVARFSATAMTREETVWSGDIPYLLASARRVEPWCSEGLRRRLPAVRLPKSYRRIFRGIFRRAETRTPAGLDRGLYPDVRWVTWTWWYGRRSPDLSRRRLVGWRHIVALGSSLLRPVLRGNFPAMRSFYGVGERPGLG